MSDSESVSQVVMDFDHGFNQTRPGLIDDPLTPRNADAGGSSQQSLLSTEAPGSPMDVSLTLKTELNEDSAKDVVIPSSLTPPPSTQVPSNGAAAAAPGHTLGYIGSQRSGIFSPPATGVVVMKRGGSVTAEYVPPTPQEVVEASADELRSMLQSCIAEHAKLKMEAAHHKLQYNLLTLQADEDAKRANVEHEMTRREVEALRIADKTRQALHQLNTPPDSMQVRHLQLKLRCDQTAEENEQLHTRLRLAKKVIQSKEDEVLGLTDEREMLLNRIRDNREHFQLLCSPGGIFHAALTSRKGPVSPAQARATPRQTPRAGGHREYQAEPRDRDHRHENFHALLEVLKQENNSAPSTPTSSLRPAPPRMPSKHTRNVQSVSSLPSTPKTRPSASSALLPSVDLLPQTEPPIRHSDRLDSSPTRGRQRGRRRSRQSTISVDDNEELARHAFRVSIASHASQTSRRSRREEEDETKVYKSQASQAASEMLRQDARDRFDKTKSRSSHHRDGGLAAGPVEKSAKLQATLFAGLNKLSHGPVSGSDGSSKKRKLGNPRDKSRDADLPTSSTKKLRTMRGLRGDGGRVGLGIQYEHDD